MFIRCIAVTILCAIATLYLIKALREKERCEAGLALSYFLLAGMRAVDLPAE